MHKLYYIRRLEDVHPIYFPFLQNIYFMGNLYSFSSINNPFLPSSFHADPLYIPFKLNTAEIYLFSICEIYQITKRKKEKSDGKMLNDGDGFYSLVEIKRKLTTI